MNITQSLLGFKQKRSAILQQRNSILKLLLIINIPNIIILILFNRYVPQPYMDQYFHYNQFISYAQGIYTWDSKITTPPGLYWIQKALTIPFGDGIAIVRGINALVFANLLAIFAMKIYEFQDPNINNLSRTINLILTPTIYFFSFLDYTDMPSIALITMAYYYNLVNSHYRLALFSLLAVYIRQNNIVWIGYLIMHRIFTEYRKSITMPRPLLMHVLNIIKIFLQNKKWIFKAFKLQFLVIVTFFAYLYKYNDGYLLFGDRENHQPCFHPTQLLYLSLFIVLNAPISLKQLWRGFTSMMNSIYLSRHALASYLFILSACIVLVDKYTLVHDFILSDNRHYIFYIYRYFFQRKLFRFALCLIYPLCIIFMVKIMVTSQEKMAKLVLWFFASIAYLCMSRLVELRYFAIPFVMFSLEIKNRESGQYLEKIHKSELNFGKMDRMIWLSLLKIMGNIIVIWIFLFRSFDDEQSRFMW